MSDPKDRSDETPFSDSAELFESLFREAVTEDEQKPPQASKPKREAKPGEELTRKPQDRSQQTHRAARDADPVGRRSVSAKKGNGIKPRPIAPLKRGGMTARASDVGIPRGGRAEKAGTGKRRIWHAVLLLILLAGGGVFAASYRGYVDLHRPIGWLLGEGAPDPAPPTARVKERLEAVQPVPSKPVPMKSEPEIASTESPAAAKETPSQETRQPEAVPSEQTPARIDTASPSPTQEAGETLPEPAIQPTPIKPEETTRLPHSDPVPAAARPHVPFERTRYPFSIFLGSFQSLDRTRKAISIYEKDHGISAYWVRVDLGDKGLWHRVFTGYFSSAGEAEAFIEAKGLEEGEVRQTRYAVLVGEYRKKEEARNAVSKLLQIGHSSYFVPAPEGGFKLYSGVFNTSDEARKQNAELASKGIQSKVVER
jgi:cell division protein FtsN